MWAHAFCCLEGVARCSLHLRSSFELVRSLYAYNGHASQNNEPTTGSCGVGKSHASLIPKLYLFLHLCVFLTISACIFLTI